MTDSAGNTMMTVRCRGTWEEGARTRLQVRRFEPFYSDEPQPLGGTDQGPNPMEYTLAALNGCISVMIQMVAHEMHFPYTAVDLTADGSIDIRGLMGETAVRPYFLEVNQRVKIATSESQERLAQLKEKVESRCPVATMFRDAGIPVNTHWERV